MKEIEIDFIEDRKPKILWRCIAIILAVILITTAVHWWFYHQKDVALKNRIATLERDRSNLLTPVDTKPDPRLSNTKIVERLLQADLNMVFNTIENNESKSARLLSLNVSLTDDKIRIEYQLDQMSHISETSSALNDGYDGRPWHLQAAAAVDNASITGAGRVTATWVASLSSLR